MQKIQKSNNLGMGITKLDKEKNQCIREEREHRT